MSTNKTIRWFKQFIFKHGICPYAEAPFHNGLCRVTSNSCSELSKLREKVLQEIELLNELPASKLSNTFVIFPRLKQSFIQFHSEILKLQKDLDKVGVEEFLLVAFHPQFIFKGCKNNDFSNFVNRS